MHILGQYRDSIVLIGGWVPKFICAEVVQVKNTEPKKFRIFGFAKPVELIWLLELHVL